MLAIETRAKQKNRCTPERMRRSVRFWRISTAAAADLAADSSAAVVGRIFTGLQKVSAMPEASVRSSARPRLKPMPIHIHILRHPPVPQFDFSVLLSCTFVMQLRLQIWTLHCNSHLLPPYRLPEELSAVAAQNTPGQQRFRSIRRRQDDRSSAEERVVARLTSSTQSRMTQSVPKNNLARGDGKEGR